MRLSVQCGTKGKCVHPAVCHCLRLRPIYFWVPEELRDLWLVKKSIAILQNSTADLKVQMACYFNLVSSLWVNYLFSHPPPSLVEEKGQWLAGGRRRWVNGGGGKERFWLSEDGERFLGVGGRGKVTNGVGGGKRKVNGCEGSRRVNGCAGKKDYF